MKILVVDDSKAMRSMVIRTLRQAGYGSHTIEDADSVINALQMIKDSPPDLIITDWYMPQMSGLALIQALKVNNLEIPFGFVTSDGSTKMRSQAIALGALFVINKPFTVEVFLSALDPILAPAGR